MAIDTVQLPKDKKSLARIISLHMDREQSRLSYRKSMWLLAWYYLNGFRRFDAFDPVRNHIVPHYLDKDGNLEFQSQDLIAMIDRVVGRLTSMDLRPKAMRQGNSLSGLRERASAQLIADAVFSEHQVDIVKSQFASLFVTLGSCGITGHITDHPTIGLCADLEVIHPKEIFPFPSLNVDNTKVRGIIRQRMVPLSFLKEIYGNKINAHKKDMDVWVWEQGHHMEVPEASDSLNDSSPDRQFSGSGMHYTDGKYETELDVVKIRELWLDGPRGTCSRYIVSSGNHIIEDQDLSSLEVYCPVGFARFMDTGTFHGIGMFDLMFSLTRELERMMKSLFNNVRDIDKYGVVLLPHGTINDRAMLRDVGKGLRYMTYSKDALMGEDFKPIVISPHNSGDAPGKVAGFARDIMKQISPLQDLIAEKGRVDSAAGLQFLDEQLNRAMTSPTSGLQRAFGQMYKASVSNASRHILMTNPSLPVNKLTLDLAGAVINQEDSTVNFKDNPIPNMSQISFAVRETNPKSEVARKQEAIQLLEKQLTDPMGVKLLALKEGLDFAMWMDEEKSAYEMVVRNILTLYGSGEDPQQIIVTPHTSRPDIQLRVLSAFMSGPVMSLSSPQVQDSFKLYRESLISFMGQTLPSMVPNPDELAELGLPDPQQGNQPQPQGPGGPMPQGALNA
tara:strand:+ start:62 stop:2083 length:2022 start_codon:yes stop_codon:yes gene_type:complete